jgi:hypothetical protein
MYSKSYSYMKVDIFLSDKYFRMEQLTTNHGKILLNALYTFKAQNTDEVN